MIFLKRNNWSLLILVIIILTTIFVHFTHESWIWGIDDSMIYKTYMKNLSYYGEFVYNKGDEKVEGFTSLLWTLIGAILFKLTDSPGFLFICINILFVYIVLLKSFKLIKEKENKSVFNSDELRLVFLSLIFLTPGFIEWNVNSQLETGMWTFLIFICFFSISKSNFLIFSFTGALMLLTRPESYMIFPLCIILFAYNSKSRFDFFVSSLVFLFVISILFIWRFNYFGYLFPNTYYAKVNSSFFENIKDGFFYVGKTLIEFPILLVSTIISLAYVKKYLLLTVFISFPYFISFIVGGDHFGLQRIFQPFIIFHYLIIIYFCFDYLGPFIKLIKSKNKLYLTLCAVLFILIIPRNGRLIQLMGQSRISHEWSISKNGYRDGEFLNVFFSDLDRKPSIGVVTTGGIGYMYKGKTIDLLGLNDIEMAHFSRRKSGPKNHGSFEEIIFFNKLPEVMMTSGFNNFTGDRNRPVIVNSTSYIKDIEKSNKFQDKYSFVMIEKGDRNIVRFILNDFLNRIPNHYKVIKLDYLFRND